MKDSINNVVTEPVQHVFLIGAKSFGAYGGYETFINKLTEYHENTKEIQYHVACKANGQGCMDESKLNGVTILSEDEFLYHNAHGFKIRVPERLGSAQAVYYDMAALRKSCEIIERDKMAHPIVYIMACRIGPFMHAFFERIHKLGGKIFLNPDGHEWMRTKWSPSVRKYWKESERLMVKYSDLIVCDSVNIEKYIHESYDGKCLRGSNPRTTFIAYGAETRKSRLSDNEEGFLSWLEEHGASVGHYYLIVGRFVPENNYKTMLREFMRSHTSKDLLVITNPNEKLEACLERELHFHSDARIKFVGTVYDQELLMKIRENAYGYLHGHEVGGTNPSLLEALGSTNLNLLLDVGFNKEVAREAALYWNKEQGNLAALIDQADAMEQEAVEKIGVLAKERIEQAYSWQFICDQYRKIWLSDTVLSNAW